MGTTTHADSKRMYSWWWDSHISPKNSKWLQENLTDMDTKVKHMIKLLEADADSFARRAEMYYKRRPELMKLVEEFYRAYRALAERYDHATGVLRQAHRSMAEAFPNQVPLIFSDDSPSGSDPRTPEMPNTRALFDPDELQKDALGVSSFHVIASKRNGAFTEESDSVTGKKGLKQFNELFGSGEGRVRKGLNFHDLQDTDGNDEKNEIHDRADKTEAEILYLKNVLAKLEAEKEESLLQCQKSQEMLSKLESEVSRAQENAKTLDGRAGSAEAEAQTLKEALVKLESEREFSLLQYQQCLDKISTLENNYLQVQKDAGELTEQVAKAGIEIHSLKQENVRVEAEKEAALGQYNKSLEMISHLEEKVHHIEEDARRYKEKAEKSESEVIILKQALAKLTEEKEAAALQYQQCLEKIARLENLISCAQEEAEKLKQEIENGIEKLKNSEERCFVLDKSNQNLQSDLDSIERKMGSHNQELIEKNQELGRLWTCVQEERLRFVEAETAFQALQHLHFQSQEELRSLAAEIQNKAQSLKEMENKNEGLENELEKVKEDRNNLNELNLSSAVSIKNLQDEVSSLREIIGKLEAEVELRVDQRNALQQEIYCLKEELKELKEIREVERSDKAALLEKLKIMGQLVEKNAFLENSLSDLHVDLESVREKAKGLEESCQSLLRENSTLVSEKATLSSQLQIATEDIKKYSEKNIILENSFYDASSELNELRVRSKSFEDSCLLHEKEKSCLISERENLVFQLEISRKTLEDRERRCSELEEKYIGLDNERQSLLHEVEELSTSLDNEKQEHANFVQVSGTQLASMKSLIHLLQEEFDSTKIEYEEEVDKVINSQIEIFILQRCVRDMEENNFSLVLECQKLLEETKLSAKLISEAENENLKKEMEVKSLFGHIKSLKMGLHQILKTLGKDADHFCEEKSEQDQEILNNILRKLKEMQNYLFETCNEKQKLEIEKSIIVEFLGQIKVEAEILVTEQNKLGRDFRIQSEEVSILKFESQKLLQLNEELKFIILERNLREEEMRTEMGSICWKLYNLEGAYQNLQGENCKVLDEEKSLKKEVINLREEKIELEEETITQSQLSFLFKYIILEKFVELKDLRENLNEIHFRNNDLEEKVKVMEANLGDVQMENLQLKKSVEKSENELVKSGEKLNLIQNEKAEVCKMVEELKTKLEVELGKMREEAEENKIKEENLSYELEKKRNEVELRENQAAALFGELQISTVREALFEGKINELTETNEKLEDIINFKDVEIEMMRERISNFGSENGGLRAQLATYVPAVISLKDAITSLEEHTLVKKDPPEDYKQEAKNNDLVNYLHSENSQPRSHEKSGMELNGTSELQDLQRRIQAIEVAVVEETLEKLNANAKLEMVMREIEEVKSGSSSCQFARTSKNTKKQGDNELRNAKQRPNSEISEEESEVLTKDILLDQISECSSYGISKRETAESDNQMHEIWDSINRNGSIDLTVGKTRKVLASSHKSKHSSTDSLVEELSVDKLEISNRISEPHQGGNKRKILERLDSDAQKLTNLQITVQDLKRKVEITEKTKKGNKGVEYDNVKGKLEESEATIVKLFNVNRKLTKNVQDEDSSPSHDETGSVRKSRISEQARRGSEKIGRLQLEVQRLQFLLLKMDDDKESRNITRVTERKNRVLLRDYLYGGVKRTSHKHTKASFCGCVQPPTKGD